MKAFSSSASPDQRTVRRVSKPVMEKRRRERINNSLEALRLLMLENGNDEKMMNPKVEKAEILESVVQFLRAEKGLKRGPSEEQRQQVRAQHSYSEGMRSCLRHVGHFIASRSQESVEADGDSVRAGPAAAAAAAPAPPGPQTYASPSGHAHRALIPAAAAALTPQRHVIPPSFFTQDPGVGCDPGTLLSRTAAPSHVPEPVWRPWPQ